MNKLTARPACRSAERIVDGLIASAIVGISAFLPWNTSGARYVAILSAVGAVCAIYWLGRGSRDVDDGPGATTESGGAVKESSQSVGGGEG